MSTKSKSRSDGKENAPPRREHNKSAAAGDIEMDAEDDGFGAFSGEDEPAAPMSSKSRKAPVPLKKSASSTLKHISGKASTSETSRKARKSVESEEDAPVLEERGASSSEEEADDRSRSKGVKRAVSSKSASGRKGGRTTQGGAASAEEHQDGAMDIEAERKITDLSNEIGRLKAQLASRVKERDQLSTQVDSLLGKKAEPDRAYERLQETTASQAKAQEKVINSLETVNQKLTARNASLESEMATLRSRLTASPTAGPKMAPGVMEETKLPAMGSGNEQPEELVKEVKSLKEKNKVLKEDLQKKDEELVFVKKEHGAEIKIATDALRIAEKKAAAGISQASQAKEVDDQAANDAIIKLYEDLTGLQVTRVNLAPNATEFKCLHSSNDRSLEFSLHSSAPFVRNASRPGGGDYGPKQLEYRPLSVEKEVDRRFVERLGTFAHGFVIPRDQAYMFFQQLDMKMSGNEESEK